MTDIESLIPALPDPRLEPALFNQAIRDHVASMVQDQARMIEQRYGYSAESTAQTIAMRPPNMDEVRRARAELAEFQRLTADMFARFMVPEPIFVSRADVDGIENAS